jgi:endonuclease/exonuclease/phosphatase family metal-dependent hydrolase
MSPATTNGAPAARKVRLANTASSFYIQGRSQADRTYPGLFPILHLDHIHDEGPVEVVGVELPRTRKSLVASDHLPLVAELRVGFGET